MPTTDQVFLLVVLWDFISAPLGGCLDAELKGRNLDRVQRREENVPQGLGEVIPTGHLPRVLRWGLAFRGRGGAL